MCHIDEKKKGIIPHKMRSEYLFLSKFTLSTALCIHIFEISIRVVVDQIPTNLDRFEQKVKTIYIHRVGHYIKSEF